MSEFRFAYDRQGSPVVPENMFGKQGVFTTFGMRGNKLAACDLHFNRLLSDAHRLDLVPIDARILKQILYKCLGRHVRHFPYSKRIRISLTNTVIQFDIGKYCPRPRRLWSKIEPFSRRPFEIKSLDYQRLLDMQNRDGMYWETILMDEEFGLTEGRSTNLLFGFEDCIVMPKTGFLPGIGLGEALKALGEKVRQKTLGLEDLSKCREIVCLNHLQGPMQIIGIPDYNWQSSSSQIYRLLRRSLGRGFSWW